MYRALIYLDWMGRAPCVREIAQTKVDTKTTQNPIIVWDVFEAYEETGLEGNTEMSTVEQDSIRLAQRASHVSSFCSNLEIYAASCPYVI